MFFPIIDAHTPFGFVKIRKLKEEELKPLKTAGPNLWVKFVR